MSTDVSFGRNARFKSGWIIVLVTTALFTLGHLGLMFFLNNPTLFAGFAAFNLYALVVILIPFRRGEKWAWLTTWILPIGLGVPAFIAGNGSIAVSYSAAAAACVLGLLLTMRDFFLRDSARVQQPGLVPPPSGR